VISEGEAEISALWQVFAWQKDALANLPKVAKIASEMDFPLTYDLYNIEKRGVRIDTKKLAQMSQELLEDYSKIEQEIYDIVGREFNIASPAQLAEVLFVDLKLPTTGIKRGKTGFSTGQKELDKLRGKSPIIEKIELAREIAKLKNTYVDALPKLVDQDSRLHTTFNQDVASTGRLSSTNPNLQNIPIRSELGRKIRQAFVADKGNVLVSADYSQFELRLAAVMSGDQELIDDFNSGVDIHAKTASELYDIALDDVNKTQRGNAKTINFSVLYGVSPHGLAANTGMSFGEAKDFIKKYFELRAPIRNYLDKILDQARKDGYVETFYGRRRPTPDVHSPNFVVRQAAERAAMNMPIQGTEADLMKRAMIDIDKKLDGVGEQILQIHDSIMVECPTENADQVAKILQDIMENIAPELDIHLKVDVHTGKHWGEL
jgi:DNA polymerase-1